jgi:hypothetical protein
VILNIKQVCVCAHVYILKTFIASLNSERKLKEEKKIKNLIIISLYSWECWIISSESAICFQFYLISLSLALYWILLRVIFRFFVLARRHTAFERERINNNFNANLLHCNWPSWTAIKAATITTTTIGLIRWWAEAYLDFSFGMMYNPCSELCFECRNEQRSFN